MPFKICSSPRLTALAVVYAALSCASATHAQNQFDLNEQTFNQWLYGNSRSVDIAGQLSAEIDGIDRICKLSAQQKLKLKLAGRGDEVRFTDRVNVLRAELVGKSYDQNEVNEIYQQIQPLAAEYQAGILGDTSLFYKVLHRTLESEQLNKFEQIQAERRQARHEARIRLFLVGLERGCPLTSEQRTGLVDILLQETRPATRASQYDQYVLLYQIAKIPEERFADLLDEAQLRVLTRTFQQGRGMEQFLRQQGLLPEDNEDADD